MPIPGTEDILSEYCRGLAARLTEVFDTIEGVPVGAGTTVHFPFEPHPQLPAPQSSGPVQPWVHIRLQTRDMDALLTQEVGWQHWTGTQSESAEQVWASAETVVSDGTGRRVVGTGVTGGAAFWVQPARPTAAIQRITTTIVFLSMLQDTCRN